MKPIRTRTMISGLSWMVCVCMSTAAWAAGPQSGARTPRPDDTLQTARTASVRTFDTPQKAADALIDAADRFDVAALEELFGSANRDVVLSGEYAQDRQRAGEFAAEARKKHSVSVDPMRRSRAFLLVGDEDWPFPVPIVKRGTRWSFDARTGRQELLYRRIGANELDAIAICRGYV